MLTLEQMTPEQKLGRVLCCRRMHVAEDFAFTLELVKNQACGAIQMPWFPPEELKEKIKQIRAVAPYPVIIINDMEQGYPQSELPKLPLGTIAAANDPKYARLFAAALAKEAKEAGFNGCWGPVIDIFNNMQITRCAGDNPEAVLEVVSEIYNAFASYRFQACGKHYPGGWSDIPIDGHMVATSAMQTKEELLKTSLVPYLKLMEAGLLPTIMVGHDIYDQIDPGIPASLSKKVIDIIREAGFDGVAYSDSFAMMSVLQTFGEKQAYIMALMAGIDIILPNYRTSTKEVYEMMLQAYREGAITDERLDEAVRRVMALEQYCACEPTDPVPVPDNVAEILNMVAKDCITAYCDEGVSTGIDTEKKRLFVVEVPMDYSVEEITQEISGTAGYDPNRVIREIKVHFPNCDIETLPEFPKPKDNDRVLTAATKYEEVVFVSFCETSAYMGTDCLTKRIEVMINALAIPGKLTALVHFGNPLAVEGLRHIPRIILGHTSPASQPHAIEVLAGKYPAKGRNPYAKLRQQMSAGK